MLRLLAKNREGRPDSAHAFLHELNLVEAQRYAPASAPEPTTYPHGRPSPIAPAHLQARLPTAADKAAKAAPTHGNVADRSVREVTYDWSTLARKRARQELMRLFIPLVSIVALCSATAIGCAYLYQDLNPSLLPGTEIFTGFLAAASLFCGALIGWVDSGTIVQAGDDMRPVPNQRPVEIGAATLRVDQGVLFLSSERLLFKYKPNAVEHEWVAPVSDILRVNRLGRRIFGVDLKSGETVCFRRVSRVADWVRQIERLIPKAVI
jgi:hypothetical protein